MVGAAQRLDFVVHALRRMETERAHRIAFKHVERFAQHHAARAGRGCRNHVPAAIIASDRPALDRLVSGEVACGDDAAMRLACSDDAARDRAVVEGGGAIARDQRERGGKIGLNQPFARLPGLAVVEEHRCAGIVLGEIARTLGQEAGAAFVKDETVACKQNGGRHQLCARPRAIARQRQFEPGNRPWNADRLVPARAEARDDVALAVLVQRGRGRRRRGFAEIDESLAPVGQPHGHEPAAADVAGCGEGHRQRVSHRHRRIDRVAAVAQHLDPGVASEMVRRDDHAVVCNHRIGRSRMGLRNQYGGQRHPRNQAVNLAHPSSPSAIIGQSRKGRGSRSTPPSSPCHVPQDQ